MSNKMRVANAAKTASALSALAPVGVGIMVGAVIAALLLRATYTPFILVSIHGRQYKLEVASTAEERKQGLSGRDSVSPTGGILFQFEDEDYHCFWMKDTKVNLDMIWLDSSRRVVDMRLNVLPETYPESFCPQQPARFVIELAAGQATTRGLGLGDTVSF